MLSGRCVIFESSVRGAIEWPTLRVKTHMKAPYVESGGVDPCGYGSVLVWLRAGMGPCWCGSVSVWLHAGMAPCSYGSVLA